MKRGRKKKSDERRSAESGGQTRLVHGLAADSVALEMPDGLEPDAVAEWRRAAPMLLALERSTLLDVQALETYCRTWGIFCRTVKQLCCEMEGTPGKPAPLVGVTLRGNPRPSALAIIGIRYGLQLLNLSRQFGFSPRTVWLTHSEKGRPAIPSEIHKMRGNPSNRTDLDESESQPGAVLPAAELGAAPSMLGEEGIRHWHDMTYALDSVGLANGIYRPPMVVGCFAYSMSVRAYRLQRKSPIAVLDGKTTGRAIENPLSLLFRKSSDLASDVWKDFGMTPSARRRLLVPSETKRRTTRIYIGDEA